MYGYLFIYLVIYIFKKFLTAFLLNYFINAKLIVQKYPRHFEWLLVDHTC